MPRRCRPPAPTTRPTTTSDAGPRSQPSNPNRWLLPKPKPKPKPQPSVVRYTVKKGDTLSGIASRYGSSVSGIQRASGISGTLIRPGQVLKVPKR